MTTDRHLALMNLMRAIEEPAKTYRRSVRLAASLATDSAHRDAAVAKGCAALDDIDTAVRDWIAAHPAQDAAAQPEFTDDRTAWMQIGATPSLKGLRAELRIEGYPPLVGRYAGAGMRGSKNLPNFMIIEPMLLFPHGEVPDGPDPICGDANDGDWCELEPGHEGHHRADTAEWAASPAAVETHVVADDSDDPEHTDARPGCTVPAVVVTGE